MMDEKHLARLLVESGRLSAETVRVLTEEQQRFAREGKPVPSLSQLLEQKALVPSDVVAELEKTPAPLAEKIAAARAEPSRRIGKFLLLEELGQGGMGTVYRAWQEDLRRVVAVKMLLRKDDPELSARFLREARLASRLRHPNIVTVFEFGESGGRAWFAMDLIEGTSFDKVEADARTNATIVSKVARALDYAHQQGVIHRDIKPSNILVGADGTPYLTDFGLARDLGSESRLTATGAMLGTPAYMSPEQADARPVDVRSDVYGLGATLYYGLARRAPHQAETIVGLMDAILHRDPVPPSGVGPLNVVTLKALEKDPSRRYPSAAALADDIDRWLAGKPIEARPPGAGTLAVRWARRRWIALAAGAALLVIAGLLVLLGRKEPDLRGWYALERRVQEQIRLKDFASAREALASFVPANPDEKRLAAEMQARVSREIDLEYAALSSRARDLASRDRFDEAVVEIRRAHPWGMDTAEVEREIELARKKFDAEALAALSGPDVLKHLERFGHTAAWEKEASRIDALIFASGETTDLPGRPRRTGDTLHWQYEFTDAARLADWSLRPLDIPSSPGYGARPDMNSVYLRNGSLRFQVPLDDDRRITAQFQFRERGHPMVWVQLGGYFWFRNREFSVVMTPSGVDLGGITGEIPREGDRIDLTMRIARGMLHVIENGETVQRIPLPEPPVAIAPEVSACRNTAICVSTLRLSGRIREGWISRTWTVQPKPPVYSLLDANSERQFRMTERGTWETTPEGLRGTAEEGQRAELHAEDFRHSRVRFHYRLEQGRYLELRVRAGTREVLYQLPADIPFGWRTVEAYGFEGEARCTIDGHLPLRPADEQARTGDGPLLRIAVRGRVTIKEATIEELQGIPREPFWRNLDRVQLGAGWTRDEGYSGTGEIRSIDLWKNAEFEVAYNRKPGARLTVGVRGREILTLSAGEGPDGFRVRVVNGVAVVEGPWCYARTAVPEEPGAFFFRVDGEPVEVAYIRVREIP